MWRRIDQLSLRERRLKGCGALMHNLVAFKAHLLWIDRFHLSEARITYAVREDDRTGIHTDGLYTCPNSNFLKD